MKKWEVDMFQTQKRHVMNYDSSEKISEICTKELRKTFSSQDVHRSVYILCVGVSSAAKVTPCSFNSLKCHREIVSLS